MLAMKKEITDDMWKRDASCLRVSFKSNLSTMMLKKSHKHFSKVFQPLCTYFLELSLSLFIEQSLP